MWKCSSGEIEDKKRQKYDQKLYLQSGEISTKYCARRISRFYQFKLKKKGYKL